MPFTSRKNQKRSAKSARTASASPRKGKGRSFFGISTPANDFRPLYDQTMRMKAALGTGGAALALLLIGRYASADFTLVIAALMGLGGLIVYDLTARRKWEKNVGDQMKKMTDHHDRLVREVARNRNDLTSLKDGFAEIASTVQAQGKRLPPATSVEAHMLGTVVEQLGKLGESARSSLKQDEDDRHILALEIAPPPGNRPPPRSELDKALSDNKAERMADSTVVSLLRHALENDRLDAFLQPVVSLPQRKICMYEVYGRLRASGGRHLPAGRYMPLAHKESLTPAVDNMLLLRCLRMLQDKRSNLENATYIMNICGGALSDSGFMNDLVTFLARNKNLAKHLVFELTQSELEATKEEIHPLLDGLSQLGCRFSLDHLRHREINVAALKARHIRFIKMDAGWLLKEAQLRGGVSRIQRLKKQLALAEIEIIVEKIENENMLRELLDFDIDYGQGWLFGKPDHHHAYRQLKKAA